VEKKSQKVNPKRVRNPRVFARGNRNRGGKAQDRSAKSAEQEKGKRNAEAKETSIKPARGTKSLRSNQTAGSKGTSEGRKSREGGHTQKQKFQGNRQKKGDKGPSSLGKVRSGETCKKGGQATQISGHHQHLLSPKRNRNQLRKALAR